MLEIKKDLYALFAFIVSPILLMLYFKGLKYLHKNSVQFDQFQDKLKTNIAYSDFKKAISAQKTSKGIGSIFKLVIQSIITVSLVLIQAYLSYTWATRFYYRFIIAIRNSFHDLTFTTRP